MIVLDEQLCRPPLEQAIKRWYKGKVICILELRPNTLVKDDVMPSLLRTVPSPTFVTSNYADFWNRIAPSPAYCAVCLKLSMDRWAEVSPILRGILAQAEFKTKKQRMGKVISWSDGRLTWRE